MAAAASQPVNAILFEPNKLKQEECGANTACRQRTVNAPVGTDGLQNGGHTVASTAGALSAIASANLTSREYNLLYAAST